MSSTDNVKSALGVQVTEPAAAAQNARAGEVVRSRSGRVTRRAFIGTGAAAGSGIVLAACAPGGGGPASSGGSGSAQPMAKSVKGGTLYFLDHTLQQAVRDVVVKRIAEFEQKFPGTKIEHDDATPDNSKKFPVLIAGGTFPDVSVTHTAFVDQYPSFMDITPYLARDKEVKIPDYFAAVLNAFKVPVNGTPRQLGVPREAHATILYYNRNAIQAVGLKEPTKDWTHQDFVEYGLKLREWTNDPATAKWAIFNGTGLGGASAGLATFWSFGADFFSEDGTKALIDQPQAREAFEYMRDLVIRHHIAPSADEHKASGLTGSSQALFNTGRYLMYACNQNCSPTTAGVEMGFSWDVMAVPQVPGRKRGTRLAANAYGLLTQGQNKNPDLGWEFIKYIVGEEGSKQLVQSATLYMSHKSAADTWVETMSRKGGVRNGKVVADVLDQWARREQTLLPGWGKAMAPIHREWDAVLNGKRSVGEMINVAKAEAEAALAAERAAAR
ncbi:MAG: extracellular solute-binding protein [Chloroflexi bacterium]|nr:extracellular solute-binding protein [Chloroflexota bacterium]